MRRSKDVEKIYEPGKWASHDLNEREMKNQKLTANLLLQYNERKSLLYWTVTDDKKRIHFGNKKRRKSCLFSGELAPHQQCQLASVKIRALFTVGSDLYFVLKTLEAWQICSCKTLASTNE